MLTKIISGGQTGADQGALEAAYILGLKTGGFAPRGYRTENGFAGFLDSKYHLAEHTSSRYPARTQSNVLSADATMIFGDISSPGSALTARYAREYNKPLYLVPWPQARSMPSPLGAPDPGFAKFIARVGVLNVAGNRESKNPGIFVIVREYLILNLTPILAQNSHGASLDV